MLPSSGRSHLSHTNNCTSEGGSVSPPSVTPLTSNQLQCQARFGKPVRVSRWSRIRSRRPRVVLDLTRTGQVCPDKVRRCNKQNGTVVVTLAVSLFWMERSQSRTWSLITGYKPNYDQTQHFTWVTGDSKRRCWWWLWWKTIQFNFFLESTFTSTIVDLSLQSKYMKRENNTLYKII